MEQNKKKKPIVTPPAKNQNNGQGKKTFAKKTKPGGEKPVNNKGKAKIQKSEQKPFFDKKGKTGKRPAKEQEKQNVFDKKKNANNKKSKLKIIFLGGIDEIGKNMTAIEYDGKILIVDCGMTFPTEEMPGIDMIIPDMSYILENKSKVKGILITHGHEDHIGAIPFLVRCLSGTKPDIYGSKLSLALIQHKLAEQNLTSSANLITVNGGDVKEILPFSVEFIRVCHSISGAFALAIKTPLGTILHTGDYKIDLSPVNDQFMDLDRIAVLGKEGILLMLGESTNVEREGYTMSEKTVGKAFESIFDENEGKRIIVATFASNVHRIQQLIDCAIKHKRMIYVAGKSMKNIIDIALQIGEISFPPEAFVTSDRMEKIPPERLLVLATGTQGETTSALTRMAKGEFQKIKIGKGDTVILSSSTIPGNERPVYDVINMLYAAGADVIYDQIRDVHVSGHARREELKLMLNLAHPTYFMPIHGEARHLHQHAKLAESYLPAANIVLPTLGGVFEVKKSGINQIGTVQAGDLFIDGLVVDGPSSHALIDRRRLSEDGFIIAMIQVNLASGKLSAKPTLISKGIVSYDEYENELCEQITDMVNDGDYKGLKNPNELKNDLQRLIKKFFASKIQQFPIIVPVIIEDVYRR